MKLVWIVIGVIALTATLSAGVAWSMNRDIINGRAAADNGIGVGVFALLSIFLFAIDGLLLLIATLAKVWLS